MKMSNYGLKIARKVKENALFPSVEMRDWMVLDGTVVHFGHTQTLQRSSALNPWVHHGFGGTTTYILLILLLFIIIVTSFNPSDKPELGMSSGNYRLIGTANRKSKIHARSLFPCQNMNNFAATGGYFCIKHYYIMQ